MVLIYALLSISNDQVSGSNVVAVAKRPSKHDGDVDRAPPNASETTVASSSSTTVLAPLESRRYQLPLALSLYVHGVLEAEIRDHAPSANLAKVRTSPLS